MVTNSESYGSDIQTPRIGLEIILVIISLLVLAYLTINTTAFPVSQLFMWVGTISLGAIVTAFVFTKIKSGDTVFNYNVMISGKPLLPIPKKLLYVIFIILFIITLFVASFTPFSISTPQFQIVEAGLPENILLVITTAIIEDVTFFVVVPGLIFALMLFFTKGSFKLSLTIMILLTPMVFLAFHQAHYGVVNNMTDSLKVYLFGLENIVMLVILRDIFYSHSRHIANNIATEVGKTMSLETLLISLLFNPIVWGVIIIILFVTVINLLRRRK